MGSPLLGPHQKSEFICPDPGVCGLAASKIPGITFTPVKGALLLGAPIGSQSSVDQSLCQKLTTLTSMCDQISNFHPQDALLLLRNSLTIPKFLFILRSSPCFLSHVLDDIDSLLCRSLSSIANIAISESSQSWLQASLPISFGGLGVRRLRELSTSAFLSSIGRCLSLIGDLLPSQLQRIRVPFYDEALSMWQESTDALPPPPPLTVSHLQKAWDSSLVESTFDTLLDNSDQSTSAWPNALPIVSLGLRLEPDVFHVAIGLRLGLSVCISHNCRNCGAKVDQFGLHGLTCHSGRGAIASSQFH